MKPMSSNLCLRSGNEYFLVRPFNDNLSSKIKFVQFAFLGHPALGNLTTTCGDHHFKGAGSHQQLTAARVQARVA